jgi:hypothetical protein
MIAVHADQGHSHIWDEIHEFESIHGAVEEVIRATLGDGCNRCGKAAEEDTRVDYVITARDEIIWWHHQRCTMRSPQN